MPLKDGWGDFFAGVLQAPELASLIPMLQFYMSKSSEFEGIQRVKARLLIYVNKLREAAVETGDLTEEEAGNAGLIQLLSVALTGIKSAYDVHESEMDEARSRAGGNPDFVHTDTGYFSDDDEDDDVINGEFKEV